MNEKKTPFQLIITGTTNHDFQTAERKLRGFFELQGGTVDKFSLTEPRPKDATYLSFATVWGYIENYMGQGDVIYLEPLAKLLGMATNTAKKALTRLSTEPLLVIRAEGRGKYFVRAGRMTLADWLLEYPLWVGTWEPKYYTFDNEEHGLTRDSIPTPTMERPRVTVLPVGFVMTKVREVLGYLDEILSSGEVLSTKQITEMFDFKSQGSAFRVMVKATELGIMEKVGPGLWSRTEQLAIEGPYRDEYLLWLKRDKH